MQSVGAYTELKLGFPDLPTRSDHNISSWLHICPETSTRQHTQQSSHPHDLELDASVLVPHISLPLHYLDLPFK